MGLEHTRILPIRAQQYTHTLDHGEAMKRQLLSNQKSVNKQLERGRAGGVKRTNLPNNALGDGESVEGVMAAVTDMARYGTDSLLPLS